MLYQQSLDRDLRMYSIDPYIMFRWKYTNSYLHMESKSCTYNVLNNNVTTLFLYANFKKVNFLNVALTYVKVVGMLCFIFEISLI